MGETGGRVKPTMVESLFAERDEWKRIAHALATLYADTVTCQNCPIKSQCASIGDCAQFLVEYAREMRH